MIGNVTDSTPTSASIAGSLTGGSTLGKDEFLKLLVAQLQNQDPLKPSDPTEFTAQLAQFSSLEQSMTTNELLSQLAQSTSNNRDMERLSAFSLIGRQIDVAGPQFHYSGSPLEFGYTLDNPADEVTLKVIDTQGQVVAVQPQDASHAGLHYSTWNGAGLNGQPLPPGDYLLQVERLDGDTTSAVSSRISSTVNGVDLSSSESLLTTGAGSFNLAEVISVTGS